MFGRLGVVNTFFSLQYYQSMMDWTLSVRYYPSTGTCNHFFFLSYFFWPHHRACGILVPQQGIEPMPPAFEGQSVNQWTTREVLVITFSHVVMLKNFIKLR